MEWLGWHGLRAAHDCSRRADRNSGRYTNATPEAIVEPGHRARRGVLIRWLAFPGIAVRNLPMPCRRF